jgi:hypothetical protein
MDIINTSRENTGQQSKTLLTYWALTRLRQVKQIKLIPLLMPKRRNLLVVDTRPLQEDINTLTQPYMKVLMNLGLPILVRL